MDNKERESTTIECGEWQEVKYSEIDTNECCYQKNHCEGNFC